MEKIDENNRIKSDLKVHLEKTAQEIKSHDGWSKIKIPDLSEAELLKIAAKNGLSDDEQTRTFCKFIAIGTNFASLNFAQRIQTVPELVNGIKDLIIKMEQEIKGFSEISNYFQNLIISFVKLVMNTKHNMKMALPHLEESIVHLTIMSEALMPESPKPLSFDDLLDVDLALTNMSCGIKALLEHSKTSKNESVDLDNKINSLKENITTKITVTENRIGFANLLPKIGATLGMVTGASGTAVAVEAAAFGGAGALVLGGFSFPPIGAVLVASAIGALGIGSILFLVIKLWEKHQFKALGYLRKILEKLNKLNSANIAFMDYMNKSEEEVNKTLANIDYIKKNVKSGSQRYRKTNADMCLQAIGSTKEMIKCINEISKLDVNQWIIDNDAVTYTILEDERQAITL